MTGPRRRRGSHVPKIYGIARALLAERDGEEAVAAARDDRMRAVYDACRDIVGKLRRDGTLAPGWPAEGAADLLWTMLSIRTWENLTRKHGWFVDHHVDCMQDLTKCVFVRVSEDP